MTQPELAVPGRTGRQYLHPSAHNPPLPADYQPDHRPLDYRYTSITTVIKRGIPKQLDNWIKYGTAEYAYWGLEEWLEVSTQYPDDPKVIMDRIAKASDRDRDHAGDQGDAAHEYFEELALGGPGSDWCRTSCGPFAPVVERFFREWQPVCDHVEVTVFSETYGYAGTLDLIAYLPGYGLVVADLKTSRSGIWPEVALQLAAIRYADYMVIKGEDGTWRREPIPEVAGGVAISIRPDEEHVFPVHPARNVKVNGGKTYTLPEWQQSKNWSTGLHVKPVVCDESQFAIFVGAIPTGDWSNVGKRSVIGDEIFPPEPIPTATPSTPYDVARARIAAIMAMEHSEDPATVKKGAKALLDLGTLWVTGTIPPFGGPEGAETSRYTYTPGDFRQIHEWLDRVEAHNQLPFVVTPAPPTRTPAMAAVEASPGPDTPTFVKADPAAVEAIGPRWHALPQDLAARVNLTRMREDIPNLSSPKASSAHVERITEILDVAEAVAARRAECVAFQVHNVLDKEALAILWAATGNKDAVGSAMSDLELERLVALVRHWSLDEISVDPVGDADYLEATARDREYKLEQYWGTKTVARGVARWQANRHGRPSPRSTKAVANDPVLYALTMQADPPESVLVKPKDDGNKVVAASAGPKAKPKAVPPTPGEPTEAPPTIDPGQCPHCPKTYKTERGLANHLAAKHPDEAPAPALTVIDGGKE